MLAANHTIVAGVAGSYIGNPFLAFLAGIIIHFILDTIPHFDTTDKGEFTTRQIALVLIDFLIGLFIIFGILHIKIDPSSPFIWGAVGGNLPDVLDNIPFWKDRFRGTGIGARVHSLHELIHGKAFDAKPVLGMLTQYIIIALFVWLYFL